MVDCQQASYTYFAESLRTWGIFTSSPHSPSFAFISQPEIGRKGNQMRKGGRVFILLGVVLALAAAVLAIFAFSDTGDDEEAEDPEERMVEVIEAAEDIPVNHVITEDDITVVEVEEDTVSPGTARTTGQVLGLAASGDIVSGQRVLMANLITPGLSHIVDDGMRAVAIPIDRVNALGGMVRAEDHIDLVYSNSMQFEDFYAALREMVEEFEQEQPAPAEEDEEGEEAEEPAAPDVQIPGFPEDMEDLPLPFTPGSLLTVTGSDGTQPVTKLILQNLRVLRVVAGDVTVDDEGRLVAAEDAPTEENDEETDDAETPPDAPEDDRLPSADLLIIEVDPEAAELVKFMLDYDGIFQIALRNPDDDEMVETPGATFRHLIEDWGMPIPQPAEVPEDDDVDEEE
jgi:pilus assembly protein CpaB